MPNSSAKRLICLTDGSASSVGSVEARQSAESGASESVPVVQPAPSDNVSVQMAAPTTSLYITHSEPPMYTR
jgi:hypothetical protein